MNLNYDRAGAWHLRAYKLAVRTGNRTEIVWALRGYAMMMKETGRLVEARRFLQRATRRATAFGRRKEAAMAHHDLMSIAVEQKRFRLAEMHASAALSLYPVNHPRIPALGHDFAFVLLRQSHHSAALPLLERVAPLIHRPDERSLVLSTLAWAAAGAGRPAHFASAERATLELVAIYDDYSAPAFLHLAEARSAARDLEHAQRYVDEAERTAAARNELHFIREAAEMRSLLRKGVGITAPDKPPGPRTQAVLRDLTARLKVWKKAPD